MTARALPEFKGSRRFTVRRRLGSGGHGAVYEAFDNERQSLVALKALGRGEPAALFRFKQEFRALAGLNHPNLVALYELLMEADGWFVTMEIVHGTSFLSYVWRLAGDHLLPTLPSLTEASTEPRLGPQLLLAPSELPPRPAPAPRAGVEPDFDRLRSGLRQLVAGLDVLHEAGKLHRDIKPSNVLVTPEGQVKILDFGLVVEIQPNGRERTRDIAGTPAYMSPEQSAGRAVTPASDWYSVGVLLYEALTGRHPFDGSVQEVLSRKQHEDAAAPSGLAPGTPEALDRICRELLCRDPERRAAGRELLRALEDPKLTARVLARESRPAGPFVGREALLSQLRTAFEQVRAGEGVFLAVHGPSGMGKSSLVQRFLGGIQGQGDVLVLESRCHSQESVPYRAVDGLVDGLSEYLSHLPLREAAALLPPDMPALARLFPVLDQVLPRLEAASGVLDIPDQQELRRRGSRALRELLARLARRVRLVVFIDDLQWGDLDSLPLILDLLGALDPPRMLFLVAYRSEDRRVSERACRGFWRRPRKATRACGTRSCPWASCRWASPTRWPAA